MSQREEADDFYIAGRMVAEHIAHSKDKDISTATLQALISDFLPEQGELQGALRGIVARPDFIQFIQLAGSEKGAAQKSAFTESLRKTYSTKTVGAIERLINGILSKSQAGSESLQSKEQSDRQATRNQKAREYNLLISFALFFLGVRFSEINAKADSLLEYAALAAVFSVAISFKYFVLDEWVIHRHQYRSSGRTMAALILAFGIILLLPFAA
jgi:hypothetical protein